MLFGFASFFVSLHYFYASSSTEDCAVEKQQQEVICFVEDEHVESPESGKMQVWNLQAAKVFFS